MDDKVSPINYSFPVDEEDDFRPRPSSRPSLLLGAPAENFDKIILHIIKSGSRSDRSRRILILKLASTCSYLRNFFMNDIYSKITIRSVQSLAKFVSYLSSCTWPGQSTALRSLTLCWWHRAKETYFETPKNRREVSKKIFINLRTILEEYTEEIRSLSLDFPGAGIAFQTVILSKPGFVSKQHLKHLHITNGLCPLFRPASYLLCAVSSLCARSLEQLFIDMGCESPDLNDEDDYQSIMKVPGHEMFMKFEPLSRLRKLQVQDVGGFTEECLRWILWGSRIFHSKRGTSLILERCQSLTEEGVESILSSMNKDSNTYMRIQYSNMEPVVSGVKVLTPDIWLSVFADEYSAPDNASALSFTPGNYSSTYVADGIPEMPDRIQDDLDTFETYFDKARYGPNRGSKGSSTYNRQLAYTKHFIQKYTTEIHICDFSANSCRNLTRLYLSPYRLHCSSGGYCSSESDDCQSVASERIVDEDAAYIISQLNLYKERRGSAPAVIDGRSRRLSGRSRIRGSFGFPIRSMSDPLTRYTQKNKAHRKSKGLHHSRDFKRLTMLMEETPTGNGFRFMSLRGLWRFTCKGNKCWVTKNVKKLGREFRRNLLLN